MWLCLTSMLLLSTLEVECISARKKAGGRITRGKKVTDFTKYPFYARVLTERRDRGYTTRCGGSILNKYEVLSAAHCLHGRGGTGRWPPPSDITARTGDFTMNEADEKGQSRSYSIAYYKFFINYISVGHGYDVVILYVSTPIVFNKFCQPLPPCLGKKGLEYHLEDPIMGIGLGWLNSAGEVAGGFILREAVFVELTAKQCTEFYSYDHPHLGAVCHNKGNEANTCKGDSGGPVFLLDNKTLDPDCVYAVVSYGSGKAPCEDEEVPSVSSRVAYYYPLLLKQNSSMWTIKGLGCYNRCLVGIYPLLLSTICLFHTIL